MAPYKLNAPIGMTVLISSFVGKLINQCNKELEKEGLAVADQTKYMRSLMPPVGVMTMRAPPFLPCRTTLSFEQDNTRNSKSPSKPLPACPT